MGLHFSPHISTDGQWNAWCDGDNGTYTVHFNGIGNQVERVIHAGMVIGTVKRDDKTAVWFKVDIDRIKTLIGAPKVINGTPTSEELDAIRQQALIFVMHFIAPHVRAAFFVEVQDAGQR